MLNADIINFCNFQQNLLFAHHSNPIYNSQWRIQSFFGQASYILEFPHPLSATMFGENF